jgi:hypothetical protein
MDFDHEKLQLYTMVAAIVIPKCEPELLHPVDTAEFRLDPVDGSLPMENGL